MNDVNGSPFTVPELLSIIERNSYLSFDEQRILLTEHKFPVRDVETILGNVPDLTASQAQWIQRHIHGPAVDVLIAKIRAL